MIRKLVLAAAAATAIGAAAFSPTAASAHWHGHFWHGGYGFYGYGPVYVGGPDCYRVKRLVSTPFGLRWRRVLVCN
jgi:hypothetical protein